MEEKHCEEIQHWIEELKKDQGLRFMNTGTANYKQLGFTILSLLNACQTHLFSLEHENRDPAQEEEEIHVDIYNLLETAKSLLPHIEFEFLDKVVGKE